jgi:4-carboxymuconolactone decarboxylase
MSEDRGDQAKADRREAGLRILGELGLGGATPSNLDDEFFAHTTAELFGTVFVRPHLTLREREMITMAVIIAVGGTYENLSFHLRAAPKVGISDAQIREIIVQTMYYSGWPRGANAMTIWNRFKAEQAAATGPLPQAPPSGS